MVSELNLNEKNSKPEIRIIFEFCLSPNIFKKKKIIAQKYRNDIICNSLSLRLVALYFERRLFNYTINDYNYQFI